MRAVIQQNYDKLNRTSNSMMLRGLQFTYAICAVAVIATGASVLLGWASRIELLKRIIPNMTAMNPVSACFFIFSGLALLALRAPGDKRRSWARVAAIPTSLVAIVGALKLTAIVTGANIPVDHLLFTAQMATAGPNGRPNQMAPNTALNFLLIGSALLLMMRRTRRAQRVAESFASITAFGGLFALIGYAYGSPTFYGVGTFNPMALHTATSFILVAIGILLCRVDEGMAAVVASDTAGGIVARRLLPLAIGLPIGLGALALAGARTGLYDTEFAAVMNVTLLVVVFVGLSWWIARKLFRLELKQQELERIRREQDERLRQMTTHIEDVFWMTTLSGNEFLYVSPAYANVWQRPISRLFENPLDWVEAIHPDDRTRVLAARGALSSTGSYQEQYRIIRPNGSIRWIRDRAYPVMNEYGQPYRIAGLAADITDSKEAQERLDRFFTVSLDLLATANFTGCFTRVNPAWERLLGWTEAELMARPFLEFVHPEDRASTIAVAAALGEGGSTIDFENRYLCRDGSYKCLLWSAASDLERQLIYAAARDITERKEIEGALRKAQADAERANRSKSEFLSRMSHELRTPLNAIIGFGQLLELDPLNAEQQESVSHIVRGGNHLLKLINEVLDISRIEAGRMTISIEPVLLAEVISEVTTMLGPLARERGISIRYALDSTEVFVQADRQRLKQVLINLLSNAIKYNHADGEVRIAARAVGEDGLAERMHIEVSDTGSGIAPEQQARLFLPFERLGAENTSVEGTGLGLALSRRLTELMGGTIGVQSSPDKGSTFWLELAVATNPADKTELSTAEAATPRTAAATVLYIEDNPSNLRLVERIVTRRPEIRLLSAKLARHGLELAQQEKPDLLLLDLHLPDMHGHEVLVALRSAEATREIPVVIVSADATAGQLQRLKEAGADDYLTKPIDVSQFLRVLDKTLHKNARTPATAP